MNAMDSTKTTNVVDSHAKISEYQDLLKVSKYRTELMINKVKSDCVKAIIGAKVIELNYIFDGTYKLKSSVTGGGDTVDEMNDGGPLVVVY